MENAMRPRKGRNGENKKIMNHLHVASEAEVKNFLQIHFLFLEGEIRFLETFFHPRNFSSVAHQRLLLRRDFAYKWQMTE